MSETDDLEASLATAFERKFETADVTDAAAKAAAFVEEYELDLEADELVAVVRDAPYDSFAHQFDYAIGDLAASIEDCTDSREFRLAGYGELAADPTQGA